MLSYRYNKTEKGNPVDYTDYIYTDRTDDTNHCVEHRVPVTYLDHTDADGYAHYLCPGIGEPHTIRQMT